MNIKQVIKISLTNGSILFTVVIISLSCKSPKHLQAITWSKRPLEHKNFEGHSGQSSFAGNCQSILAFAKGQDLKTYPHVSAIFIPHRSWLLNYDEDLLTHEQYHFNITELYARVFRKIVAENKIDSLLNTVPKDSLLLKNYQDGVFFNAIIIMQKQLAKLQNIYDEQTRHSLNKQAQIEWQIHIDSLLNLHQAYYREYPDSLFPVSNRKYHNYKK